jgi:bacterioferritin (cytochrome b1)
VSSIFDGILESKRKKALERVARQEYEQSRGSAHAQMLRAAREQAEKKRMQILQKQAPLQKEWQRFYEQSQARLIAALRYIVETRLHEVPGIGSKLQDAIMRSVFHGKLSDLRYASRVSGIGGTKQYAINIWINKYEAQTQELLKKDFPGRSEIIASTSPAIEALRKEVEALEQMRKRLEERIAKIDKLLNEFCFLTEENFIQARINEEKPNPKIENYLRGIFAEWEAVPGWFQELIKED